MKGQGIKADQAQIDWRELMHFKRSMIERVPQSREESFSKTGIAAFHGRARFISDTAVQVDDFVLEARNVVIAAGAQPVDLGIPGAEDVITSEQFLELDQLPGRMVFIGGGYISFEFAHLAARAGCRVRRRTAAENILEGNRRKPNYAGVASVVFTVPPLASVGLLESTAGERGLKFRVNHKDTSSWYSSRRVGQECSGFKILIEESTDHVLGAHLLGPSSDETINIFALAVRKGLIAADLRDNLFAYPTHGSDFAIHGLRGCFAKVSSGGSLIGRVGPGGSFRGGSRPGGSFSGGIRVGGS